MPRPKGFYGQYGLRGHSKLALRRQREAENPGFKVCRRCDGLIPESDLVPYALSPICRPCHTSDTRARDAKRPKPNGIHAQNRSLAESGLKHCTTCGEDKPLDRFYSFRGRAHGSKCRGCKDAQVQAWQERKTARSGRGPMYAWHAAAQTKIGRECRSLERRLSYCVSSVFKRLAKVCPKCGVDKPHGMYSIRRRGVGIVLAKTCKVCVASRKRSTKRIYRSVVFKRDGGTCVYCGLVLANTPNGWHMDHVWPLSRGGENTLANVVVACESCNLAKGDKMLLDFLWQRAQVAA